MKKVLVLLVMLLSFNGFSQSINNYKYVVVPLKFDFISSDNQYRLATLSKFNLNKAGFAAFYDNESLPSENIQRCDILSFDVVKEKSFLTTKLHVIFKDCYGKVIYQSETGVSKQKDYQLAYTEALNDAFESIYALNYKYTGLANAVAKVAPKATVAKVETVVVQEKKEVEEKLVPVAKKEIMQDGSFLYAQPVLNGFQLVDTTPKVVMKVFKTSIASCYIADKEGVSGVLISKEGQWYFEYYKNDKLFSEKIAVKF
ncbi:hypothetical protein [Flavobacterium muglaense]|uniref:WG repeat-containing protein n=1 Tax=Flavobacterium muglaense TaxID=2764716 RepID=A0A923MXI6_9FLAO|nr:hypothetical protein [Flavobacterium muglaense]MBC5836975.1 hypothetical protein [Flavobacterium muglaense]MBC5843504.1 hypothetical protein [Flavobacterium muglaense]